MIDSVEISPAGPEVGAGFAVYLFVLNRGWDLGESTVQVHIYHDWSSTWDLLLFHQDVGQAVIIIAQIGKSHPVFFNDI